MSGLRFPRLFELAAQRPAPAPAELVAFGGVVQRERGDLADARATLAEAVRRGRHLGDACDAGAAEPDGAAAARLTAELRAMAAAWIPTAPWCPAAATCGAARRPPARRAG